MVEVYTNGFIRPFKSPVGAPRQARKGLSLPKNFLLADASMGFHLQQCRHTVCVKGLTQLQITEGKLLIGGLKDNLWLSLKGQECPRHDEYWNYTDILASKIMLSSWLITIQVTRKCSHPF